MTDSVVCNTLIPPSHETAAVTVDCRLYFTLEWTREVNTTLYRGRHPCWDRRYEWDGGIRTLKTLNAHGLPGRALWDVTQATLMAQIAYAIAPLGEGLSKQKKIARLKAILLKARRYGYLPTDFHSLEDLMDFSDESLYRSIRYNPQHVLHQLLPPHKHISVHGLIFSDIPFDFMRKIFINRMLFSV